MTKIKGLRPCDGCGSLGWRKHCSDECRRAPARAVYCFTCPDSRVYVGSTSDHRSRDNGVRRANPRLDEALGKYPSETWSFEVLETLPAGSSSLTRREAEQRHIERLQSQLPERGFNMQPAVLRSPALIERKRRADLKRAKWYGTEPEPDQIAPVRPKPARRKAKTAAP